ncbi:MAG TPA: hypothetical protein VJC16_01555 [Candidatus Nanoarchaeia archaeon]|nr:hypothetical protein [Candidatus Nanoarchaeia archaeon]
MTIRCLMVLEIVIPEADQGRGSTKDMVFSILVEDTPKTLTQLHREIKRRYGVSVSFQAVIKAMASLRAHSIIVKDGRLYTLNKDWIFEARRFFDSLYMEYFKVRKPMKKLELGKEVTVYTVSNLFELDRLWNDLLANWAKKETADRRNAWRGRHCWWLIPRLQEEDILHDLFAREGIRTYNLMGANTLLDKIAFNYYRKRNEHVKIKKMARPGQDYHLSAFGSFLVKFEIPEKISMRLEGVYMKTRRIEDLDLKKVADIFKENHPLEVTVINDRMLSDKIKEDIIASF